MRRLKKLIPYTLLLLSIVTVSCNQVQKAEAQQPAPLPKKEEVIIKKVVINESDTTLMEFVNGNALFTEGWDSLAQPKFWKQIMCLPPDSCIINVASSRTPLQVTCYRTWCSQSENEKTVVKSGLRNQYCVEYGEELFVTNGKREFYEHRKSIPTISKAVHYFNEFGVDPWYAQTILLIESPGKHTSKSYVGAAGPFQLMRSVALRFGLKVNKYVDERTDLKRAAYGASRLLSTICIPQVKAMLDKRNISYKETDTWFRLLVLHAYHAGSGNLSCAMNKINPTEGGQELIRTLWKTQACGFKNESQNYSQIALAAILNFEEILRTDGDSVFLIQGDKAYAEMKRSGSTSAQDKADQLLYTMLEYERDLADGTITYAYFANAAALIKAQLSALNVTGKNQYPADDAQLTRLSTELLHKRKMEDAIQLLRFNMDAFPQSSATAALLGKAYRMNGNAGLGQKYMTKSNELINAR
jgi:hypothetical protein